MIQNILFDMGGVLVCYDPAWFTEQLPVSREDRALLLREIFRSAEWVQIDRGVRTEAEALALFQSRLPRHLHGAAEELVLGWDRFRRPYEGMEELVEELGERGYCLCLLSNAGKRHHEYWPTYPISRFFGDRVVISADLGLVKPEGEYFRRALEKLGVRREESLFIDDSAGNVESAWNFGLEAVVFHGDVPLLRRALVEKGIL